MSGHVFLPNAISDLTIYAGARLLEILSLGGDSLAARLSDLPRMVNTPEIRMDCPEDKKFSLVSEVAAEFKRRYPVIDVDGARVLFEAGGR